MNTRNATLMKELVLSHLTFTTGIGIIPTTWRSVRWTVQKLAKVVSDNDINQYNYIIHHYRNMGYLNNEAVGDFSELAEVELEDYQIDEIKSGNFVINHNLKGYPCSMPINNCTIDGREYAVEVYLPSSYNLFYIPKILLPRHEGDTFTINMGAIIKSVKDIETNEVIYEWDMFGTESLNVVVHFVLTASQCNYIEHLETDFDSYVD